MNVLIDRRFDNIKRHRDRAAGRKVHVEQNKNDARVYENRV